MVENTMMTVVRGLIHIPEKIKIIISIVQTMTAWIKYYFVILEVKSLNQIHN